MEMRIGKNIKKYRNKCELTQIELGKRLDVSNKTISSWESDRTEPDSGSVQKMLKIFGCTIDELTEQINVMVSYDEYRLLEQYRRATSTQRAQIRRLSEYLIAFDNMEKTNEKP